MPDTYIRFNDALITPTLNGEKTLTARLGFDRNLSIGEVVDLRDESDETFAEATITCVEEMTPREFVAADFEGHQSYESLHHFLDALRQYYPDDLVGPDATVMVIHFTDVEQKS